MVISDENSSPILIDNIYIPTNLNYFWVLNLDIRDFKLQELKVLEQIYVPIINIKNIKLCNRDTFELERFNIFSRHSSIRYSMRICSYVKAILTRSFSIQKLIK